MLVYINVYEEDVKNTFFQITIVIFIGWHKKKGVERTFRQSESQIILTENYNGQKAYFVDSVFCSSSKLSNFQ